MKRLLWIMPVFLALSSQSETEEVSGITWSYQIVGDAASVGGGVSGATAVAASTTGVLTIPSMLGGLPVTRIGDYAFEKCYSIKKVVIPNGVTDIGNYAFSKCWSLTSLELPVSVKSLGAYAFDCAGLTTFEIPNGVVSIEDGTFEGTSLTLISIPDGVKRIGNYAFRSCYNLSAVTIPQSVENIGQYAFDECPSLGDGLVVVDGCVITMNGDCPEKIILPAETRLVAGGVFFDCRSLVDITMPEGLISIGDSAFCNCSSITNLTFPSTLKLIESSAFFGCEALKTVTMQNGVEAIGDSAFCSCAGLVSIALSAQLKSIEPNAFYGCRSLNTIDIPEGVGAIGYNAFYICKQLESVSIPNSVTNIEHDAFAGCVRLGDGVVIDNGCVLTANGELQGTVEIPKNVRLIAAGALAGRLSVERFSVEDGNKWFAEVDGVLYNKERSSLICCPGGKLSLNVCEGVRELDDYSCNNCRNLIEVSLPQSLQKIGRDAFEFCYGLNRIELPASVRSIGVNAFVSCNHLSEIQMYSTEPPILGKSALGGASSLKTINVPFGFLETYKSADGWSGYAAIMVEMKEQGDMENPWRIGNNIRAYINDGHLHISGCGTVVEAPWSIRALEITEIEIAPEVTDLCGGVFSGMANLKSINGLSTRVFNSVMGAVDTNLSITSVDPNMQTVKLSVGVLKTVSIKDAKWEKALEPVEIDIPVRSPVGFFKLEQCWDKQ